MNALTKTFGIVAFFCAAFDWNVAPPAERDFGRTCLALVAYSEARSEGDAGMLAVMRVVLNRVRDPSHRWPQTICDVVSQPGQFAGVESMPFPRRVPDAVSWDRAQELTDLALGGAGLPEQCKDATYFHRVDIPAHAFACVVGAHTFYTESAAIAATH